MVSFHEKGHGFISRGLGALLALVLFLGGCQGTLLGKLTRKKEKPQVTKKVEVATPVRVSAAAAPAPTPVPAPVSEAKKTLVIYSERSSQAAAYFPTGRMGDWGDIRFDSAWESGAESSSACIRVEYLSRAQGNGWAGMIWQYPPNNWGAQENARDLRGAKKLVFWARGRTGREVISQFMSGGTQGEHPDTDRAEIGPVYLSREWKRYEIELKNKRLNRIAGGFTWAVKADENPGGAVFYLDDIYYEW